MAMICSLVFWIAGDALIDLMTTSAMVREAASVYLIWVLLIPITGMLAFQFDGVFIGATWSRDMTYMMILSLIIYLLAWQLLEENFGNHGLWLALHVFLLARGLTLALRVGPKAKQTFINAQA